MAHHTPGPWTVDYDYDQDGRHGINSEGRQWKAVATVTTNKEGASEVGSEEAEANARLIAAAPDLLAACLELLTWATRVKDVRAAGGPVDAVFKAIDAVAQTRGE